LTFYVIGRKQGKSSDVTESEQGTEDEVSSEEDDSTVFKGAKPTDEVTSDRSDEEKNSSSEDGFIVKDEGPANAVLPVAFSMQAHEDLSYQFKKIFQFFVHVAVRPPNQRHKFMKDQLKSKPFYMQYLNVLTCSAEDYFSVPLQHTRKKITGIRDSLVASSVWKPQYKRALETYSTFDIVLMDYALPGCDACNLGSRKSTRMGRLSGPRYDPLGFIVGFLSSSLLSLLKPNINRLGMTASLMTRIPTATIVTKLSLRRNFVLEDFAPGEHGCITPCATGK
jgi:hypothetical protein